MKYLDYVGLSYLWSKLKAYFVSKEDFIENEEVVAAALTDLNERKLDAADLPSWASNDTKPSYNLDEIADGTTNKAYTATEKTKLAGIESGAEANVKPDWNATSGNAAGILNKPNVYQYVDQTGFNHINIAEGPDYVQISGEITIGDNMNRVSIKSGRNKNITVTPGGTGKLLYKSNEVLTTSNLNSPALTGTPTAPTAIAGTNTTQLATTAFVNNAISSFNVYGTSSTAAATVQKEVSIPSIKVLNEGQIIVVKPTVTSTVANSTLKLNSFEAYPMRYNNAAITTSTDSVVWSANFPSWWVFDGDYWVFLGHGLDSNTQYANMTQDHVTEGTSTTGMIVTPKRLRDNFYTKEEIDDTIGDIETLLAAI